MKKALILAILALTLLISTTAVSAQYHSRGIYNPYNYNVFGGGYFAPVVPNVPMIDPSVRGGGSFIGASPYMVGLRGPIYTHTPQNLHTRYSISSAYYPRTTRYGSYGDRFYRVGGRSGSFNTVSTAGGFAWRAGSLGSRPVGDIF